MSNSTIGPSPKQFPSRPSRRSTRCPRSPFPYTAVSLILTDVEAITDYRFDNRINSMSDATRRLIEAGLAAERKKSKSK